MPSAGHNVQPSKAGVPMMDLPLDYFFFSPAFIKLKYHHIVYVIGLWRIQMAHVHSLPSTFSVPKASQGQQALSQ